MPSDPDTPPATPFTGFDVPRQNWFKMPSNWTDITADISSIAELKVVEYVLKHTWGYQEYGVRKRITNDEFMHGRRRKDGDRIDKGTGLSKPSVIAGLKAAVERGLLIEEIDNSDRARVKKYYSLRMMPDLGSDPADDRDGSPESPDLTAKRGGVKDLNAGVKDLYPEVKTFYPRGKESLPRTEKETLERNIQKENNNNTDGAETQPTDVVVAFLLEQGIAKGVAERLANRYNYERVAEKVEFLAYLKDEDPQKVKNPQGWLRRAIEEDYAAPDGYTSVAEREAEAAEKLRQEEAIQHAIAEQEQHRRTEQALRQQAAAARALAALQTEYGTTQQEQDLWQQVLAEFKVSQPAGTFGAYLADTVLLSLRDGEALIGLPNVWMRDWVENRLSHKIGQSLALYLDGQKVTPKFIALSQAEATAGDR